MSNKYNLKLYGKKEFYPDLNNKIYKIIIINTPEKEDKGKKILYRFYKSINKTTKDLNHYMGLDFEFNKVYKDYKKVALMQICLEENSNKGYILIVHPPTLQQKTNKLIIKLLTSKYIIRILHGSESLDIPYMFNQLLIKPKYINKFCKNFFDTKLICDYLSLTDDKLVTGCSIYNLLVDNKIITEEKFKELEKIDIIKEVDDVNKGKEFEKIDINNLDDIMIYYALYDVLYLQELIKKYFSYNNNKIIYTTITEILEIISKSKQNIDITYTKLVELIKKMNVYYIIVRNKKISLHMFWEKIYAINTNTPFDYIKNINYYKSFFKIITKLFLFIYISNNQYIIYINKNNIFDVTILEKFIKWLSKYKYVYELFKNYEKLFIYNVIF
jgi:hypothetical protein